VVKDLASLKSSHGTTADDLFGSMCVCVCETLKELELPWTKLKVWQQTGLHVWLERKQVWWVKLDEKWTHKIQNFTFKLTASSLKITLTRYVCFGVSFELHLISSPVSIFHVGNWWWIWGRHVPYRSPMVELWDSGEMFCSFEVRYINVQQWERQICG
jgi:hypothetical protein